MFCKALLCSALQKLKTNEMGSMLSAYNGFITDFVSMLIWVMAMWLLNCSTILSRVFFAVFLSNCFYYNFGVFYPIFNFKPAFESQEYVASTRAYLTFVYSTPNIYILAYIYTLFLMFFSYFLANFQKFKNPKKSPLDISKTHLWLKFHEILTIFVTASGPERKMYAFLSQILTFF